MIYHDHDFPKREKKQRYERVYLGQSYGRVKHSDLVAPVSSINRDFVKVEKEGRKMFSKRIKLK